jgi:carboxyl-terminal processing protease
MTSLKKRSTWLNLNRRLLAASVGALLAVGLSQTLAWAEPQATNSAAAVAQVRDLRTQAVSALKAGEFDRAGQLLGQANTITNDPSVQQMKEWFASFETQRQAVLAERKKVFDEQMSKSARASEKGFETFAIDYIADAYTYAPDKAAFRKLPEVEGVIARTVELAQKAEDESQWLAAVRLYADLTRVEPGEVTWHRKFKEVAKRVRLLAMYTPDRYAEQLRQESNTRLAALKVIDPSNPAATQPATTRPADENEETDNSLRTNWQDILKGIKAPMLADAFSITNEQYFREVSFKELTVSGLTGLRVLATTGGLEDTFANLKDDAKRQQFIAVLEEQIAAANASNLTSRRLFENAYRTIIAANDASLQLPTEVLINTFAEAAFGNLDQFTTMIWPSELADMKQTLEGVFTGVGIQIQSSESGELRVISPIEDSPALRAGVEPDSVITHIDAKSAKGISVDRAKREIQGAEGTQVTLTIRNSAGETKDFVLTRQVIKMPTIKGWTHAENSSNQDGWDYMIDPEVGIGYVRLTSFTKESAADLKRVVEQVTDAGGKGLILDLRDNPGGQLFAAVSIVDQFLPGGRILSTKGERPKSPEKVIDAKASNDDSEIPLVVLVNQFSASASEIVSGALKDHARAVVVGERTFGKGSVQNVPSVANNTAQFKMTTSHYYLPSGRCIHKEDDSTVWGVDPDMHMDMTREQMIEARQLRQKLDVLRTTGQPADAEKAARLLQIDPQLSAGLLLLRLQVTSDQPLLGEANTAEPTKKG